MVIAQSKKVKPIMNNTIKSIDYNWSPEPGLPNNQEIGVPRAVFIPHSNSLPFEERRVTLEQPVKIGRNVYRAIPSPTNTIFECRVLSRHHATLYYDKGHFYLVDNQSSNGTFINNNRCPISKDQDPHEVHEVFSGDVVQFGIPVVENTSNSEKNTFPPVVALLKLYHPDGKEAKLSYNPTMTTPLHLKELYQLNEFVQEAIQREASLESRLRTLRECVERTRAEAQTSWELFVGEQRLLMRVHTLETMLAVGKQPDAKHVARLLSDKRNYQEVAQESLKAAHEQRLSLEESLERRGREAAALHQHNCALRLAATNALQELQKLAARCERKMCAARLAISAAEEREQAVRKHLPLAYSVQNGEAKMLVLSTDSNKVSEAKRGGTIEEALRTLPDYIKLLLPQQLLNKVGIKAISSEGKSAKEFELILKKNNIYNSETSKSDIETQEKQLSEGSQVSTEGTETEDKPAECCTDDEKQSRLNHDGELEDSNSVEADNNANSTYSETSVKEESSKASVEYANILRVMAGLNDEIKLLRERLNNVTNENEQLKNIRDELLAATIEAHNDNHEHDNALQEDAVAYTTRIADLQAQLAASTLAEEANMAEIQRLSTNASEMQAELAFRPTRADIDDLTDLVGRLRADVQERDNQLETLKASNNTNAVDKSVATSRSLEELNKTLELDEDLDLDTKKISQDIDEMFNLEYDEEEETDSIATEINNDAVAGNDNEANESNESNESNEASDTAPANSRFGDYVRIDDNERLEVTLANGTLHALEEELVRAKERWAEVTLEKAHLAAQLAAMQTHKRITVNKQHISAVVVVMMAVYAFYVFLPYVS